MRVVDDADMGSSVRAVLASPTVVRFATGRRAVRASTLARTAA
jgi:hypothetical protein